MKCYMCDVETNYYCEGCAEPVCEGCCVQMTVYRTVDYILCTECDEAREAQDYLDRDRQWKQERVEKKKRDARNAQRRKNYWKPENVEKRKQARYKRQDDRHALKMKQWNTTMEIVRNVFNGI